MIVVWFSGNILETCGAHVTCLSVVISRFFHSINWEEWVWPINIILCNTLTNTKICQNKSKVCLFMVFFCFADRKLINLGVVSWCSVNYVIEGNPTKILSKCLQKYFSFSSSCFLLLIINETVDTKYLCRQDLQIRVLENTQNNISHPKSLVINYIII